jgi:menaquinone-dependent protoporphyrinogen oxidase
MKTDVLVAYGSNYVGTTGIAQRIAEVLRGAGLKVDVLTASVMSSTNEYGAVVLGSAMYAGQWTKEAAPFLEHHVDALRTRSVWLFSSGPTGEGDPVQWMHGWRFPDG